MNNLDKEYHPVIEDYILKYVDEEMGSVERAIFEEVLVHDDDLRELAFSAKEGKRLLEQFRTIKTEEEFFRKLIAKLSSEG